MFNSVRPTILVTLTVLSALLGGTLTGLAPGASASAAAERTRPRIVSRAVVFDVENTNRTSTLCVPDDKSYHLRGRLVGSRRALEGLAGARRVNVLVHDLSAGSWFWRMPGHPRYDYARHLAARGEVSLVLDRLGYGASRLPDGSGTCLGAQADMLHQVVQHLRSGRYDYVDRRLGTVPAAAHVVTQGHAVGAAIAQVEAGTYDDVDGLVLMSWTDGGATGLATRTAAAQTQDCGLAKDYAQLAGTAKEYRSLFFASAPAGVQKAAARLRNPDPCGDVRSLSAMLLAARGAAGRVDAPVLLLYGSKDALNRPGARRDQAGSYSTRVTTRTFAGAGSALPLERQAARVRGAVLRWLG
jgi:hypothetical protein